MLPPAGWIVIEGRVTGGIRADFVHLRAGCMVDGDVTAEALRVDDGAHFEGRALRPAR